MAKLQQRTRRAARPAPRATHPAGAATLPRTLLAGAALVAGTLTGVAIVVAWKTPAHTVASAVTEPVPVAPEPALESAPAAPVPAPAPAPAPGPALPVDPAPVREVAREVERAALPAHESPAPWEGLTLLPRDDRPRGPVALPDVTRPGASIGEPTSPAAAEVPPTPPAAAEDEEEVDEADDLPPVLTPPPAPRSDDRGAPAVPAPDTGSPVALALRQLLHVPHTLGADGRVQARYTFSGQEEVSDFEWTGFDKLEVGEVVGRNLRTVDLELGVGSRRVGRLAHVLPLRGDVQIDVTVWLNQGTSRSDLVFLLGNKVGVRWGQQIVRATRSGDLRPVAGAQPDRGVFREERLVRVRLTRTGDTLTVECDGRRVAQKAFKPGELDGRFGILASDLRVVITELKVDGVVDPAKL
ncbi:MAG: hypothetical protein M9894_19500 [Planctomycetes bacterium]|nr:hypothetical protein [Planctomycetota bacterium]